MPVQDVRAKLGTFDIKVDDLLVNLQPTDSTYTFNYSLIQEGPRRNMKIIAHFSPADQPSWIPDSINGKKAGKKNKKAFQKRMELMSVKPAKIDSASLTGAVLSYYFIVTFSPDTSTIPPLYAYLKDCTAKAYINMATRNLEKITWENIRGTVNGDIKVSSVHLDVFPSRIDGKYKVVKEWCDMNSRNNDKLINYQETILYSAYRKL